MRVRIVSRQGSSGKAQSAALIVSARAIESSHPVHIIAPTTGKMLVLRAHAIILARRSSRSQQHKPTHRNPPTSLRCPLHHKIKIKASKRHARALPSKNCINEHTCHSARDHPVACAQHAHTTTHEHSQTDDDPKRTPWYMETDGEPDCTDHFAAGLSQNAVTRRSSTPRATASRAFALFIGSHRSMLRASAFAAQRAESGASFTVGRGAMESGFSGGASSWSGCSTRSNSSPLSEPEPPK